LGLVDYLNLGQVKAELKGGLGIVEANLNQGIEGHNKVHVL